MSKGVQIAGGATLIALLLGWYAASNLEAAAAFTYYQDVGAFRDAARPGERARVHGYVSPGTIQRDVPALRVSFQVQGRPPHAGGEPGRLLRVVLASLETPDLFKDGAEVVVEGELARSDGAADDALFHADKLLAKCPSKFEARAADAASS